MIKKILISSLILAVACYLLQNAYEHRNVATFLWATSCFLLLVAIYLRRFRDVSIIVISITVTLALVEISLGYLPKLLAKPDNRSNNARSTYFDTNQEYNTSAYWQLTQFGSQPRPGKFRARKLASDGEMVYDVNYSIGQDGFRITPEYESGAPSNNGINFLGDSFTFGEGLQDDETMAYYTGDLVRQSGRALTVKNYGMSGGGVHQALAILQSKLNTSAKTQFILTSPWHASRAACADFFTLGSPKYLLENSGYVSRDGYCRSFSWVEHSPKAVRGLITSSNIFKLIQDSLFVASDQDKQIDLYLGILRTAAKESKSRDETLVIGFIKADEKWFVGSYDNEKVFKQIQAMGIDVIDMTLTNRNEDLPKKYYLHELDKHPTAAANLERARLLSQRLKINN
jgi:hypothetical protein